MDEQPHPRYPRHPASASTTGGGDSSDGSASDSGTGSTEAVSTGHNTAERDTASGDGIAFPDFLSAARATLARLHADSGLQLWMITRVVGDEQLVLLTHGHRGPLNAAPGQARAWQSSLCQAMVAGGGPSIAPNTAQVGAYAQAADGPRAGVHAYAGAPLRGVRGELLGTVRGVDGRAQPPALQHLHPQLHLSARLLATVLVLELQAHQQQRRTERAQIAAGVDALTDLANRRVWDQSLTREEARCQRYGQPACVVVLDLDGLKQVNDTRGHAAGDALLRACARQLREHARAGDLIARLGGDEFAVLLIACDERGGRAELARLRAGLAAAGIAASAGLGVRRSGGDLAAAWHEADAAMYRSKHAGRAGRSDLS
ncbi:GGDEF domain-containing protein [Kineococcus sp. SYSU DK005]|uniref:GGDEF domain-containing protein n=1 Tax=Kineococcus sp. SYSU DK005 TaxID=3383126 RepID=UPI003D7E8FF0